MAFGDFMQPLAGGALIGGASAGLLHFNGRIAGISGMLRGLFGGPIGLWAQRALFLLGLVSGAALFYQFDVAARPLPRDGFPPLLLVVSGALVGVGTSLAKGCTSGHGVCGLARFSLRSLVAVVLFLSTAIATTSIVRHVFGID